MAKVVTIDACRECPYNHREYCYLVDGTREIDDDGVIPSWCQLPDEPEGDGE